MMRKELVILTLLVGLADLGLHGQRLFHAWPAREMKTVAVVRQVYEQRWCGGVRRTIVVAEDGSFAWIQESVNMGPGALVVTHWQSAPAPAIKTWPTSTAASCTPTRSLFGRLLHHRSGCDGHYRER